MPGWVGAIAGLLKSLIGPLTAWWANRKGKEAGKTEEQRDAAERELEAVDDARAADDASRDERVRRTLDSWRDG